MKLHHVIDSDVIRYCQGAVYGLELAALEEHFLWCTGCSSRLEKAERSGLHLPDGPIASSATAQPDNFHESKQ